MAASCYVAYLHLCSLGFDLYYPHASLNHLSPIFDSDMHLMFLFAILHTQRKLHVCERLTHQQLCGTDELIASIRRRQVVVWLIAASASHWLTPCSISKIELICRIWGI